MIFDANYQLCLFDAPEMRTYSEKVPTSTALHLIDTLGKERNDDESASTLITRSAL